MPAGGINKLLEMWAATLAPHNQECDHEDLYATIDATLLGDILWENFTVKCNGDNHADEAVPWMSADHYVWFHNPISTAFHVW